MLGHSQARSLMARFLGRALLGRSQSRVMCRVRLRWRCRGLGSPSLTKGRMLRKHPTGRNHLMGRNHRLVHNHLMVRKLRMGQRSPSAAAGWAG